LQVKVGLVTTAALLMNGVAIAIALLMPAGTARSGLLALEAISALCCLLGAALARRNIVQPMRHLTHQMEQLVAGDTDFAVAGTGRRDEIGLISRTVEAFRDSIVSLRRTGLELQRKNLQLDAALNSMVQGILVWGADQRVELVNQRYYEILGIEPGSVTAGMTVEAVAANYRRNGLHLDKPAEELADIIRGLITFRRSTDKLSVFHAGLFVRVQVAPMGLSGAVITYEDITEHVQSQERVTFLAHHDALTGLPNRKMFQEYLDGIPCDADAARSCAVLCLDLDHFKEVNDTLGHAAGDELLRAVAGRLRACLRAGDLAARLGGDEFAIVLALLDDADSEATAIAARLVATIGTPYDVLGNTVVIGVSVGVALSGAGISGADLLKRADVALYKAKEERGTHAFYAPGMDDDLLARRALEADLRLALHRNEFVLNYQPLFDVTEQRVKSFEALVRWNSPTRGPVQPAAFMPLAEQTGMIRQLGEWVLRRACTDAALWPGDIGIAVNLSAEQIKSKSLISMVRDTLEETGLAPRRLALEITETALPRDTGTVVATLNGLRSLGVRIAMDDFGTGASSLGYLRQFPFDKIKIDRSFVQDLGQVADGCQGRHAAMIVQAIVGIGNTLGISTTAEGVETVHQFTRMRESGCTEVQGYFISPPLPVAQIGALLDALEKTVVAPDAERGHGVAAWPRVGWGDDVRGPVVRLPKSQETRPCPMPLCVSPSSAPASAA
jgi:diguanylate cyclase (GGDEF)-like protein